MAVAVLLLSRRGAAELELSPAQKMCYFNVLCLHLHERPTAKQVQFEALPSMMQLKSQCTNTPQGSKHACVRRVWPSRPHVMTYAISDHVDSYILFCQLAHHTQLSPQWFVLQRWPSLTPTSACVCEPSTAGNSRQHHQEHLLSSSTITGTACHSRAFAAS